MGIQMKQKDLTKTLKMISNLAKLFDFMVYTKLFQRIKNYFRVYGV